jgi:hypothetical protein
MAVVDRPECLICPVRFSFRSSRAKNIRRLVYLLLRAAHLISPGQFAGSFVGLSNRRYWDFERCRPGSSLRRRYGALVVSHRRRYRACRVHRKEYVRSSVCRFAEVVSLPTPAVNRSYSQS